MSSMRHCTRVSQKQQRLLSTGPHGAQPAGHERLRRRGDRRRRRRPVRRTGAVPGPPHGAGRGRRRTAQRPGRPHAGLPVPRRHAARATCSPSDATRCTGYGGTRRRRRGQPSSSPDAGPGSRSCSPTASGCPPAASLVATGLRDELPDIPGLRERWAPRRAALPLLPRLGGTRPAARRPRRYARTRSATPRSSGSGADDVVFFAPPAR